jgi:spore coat polysaccharide biosynthesis predicted glycosyltransferase SpsG
MADRVVAFICDGDPMAGLGHVSRCVGLAEAWSERGVRPVFVGPVDAAARLVDAAGFAIDPAVLDTAVHAVAVDSYRMSDAEIAAIAARHPVVCIDDFAARAAYPCVAVVNVTMHGEELEYPDGVPLVLAGPRHLIIRRSLREFRAAGNAVPADAPVDAVVVAIGGVDHHDLGARVVRALARVSEPPSVRVLVPSGAPSVALLDAVAGHGRAAVLTGVFALAEMLAGTGAVISGGGLTKYEAAYAGVATAVLSQTAEQDHDTERFAALGLGLDLGPAAADGDDAIAAAIDRFVTDRAYRRALVETSLQYFPPDPTAAVVRALDDALARNAGGA